VVASGPSAGNIDVGLARGASPVIVINESWRRAPWADVLYACDHAWWRHRAGVPEFRGVKIAGDRRASNEGWGVLAVRVRRVDTMVFGEPDVVGRGGGASGFQAVNLAVNRGAHRILLVGFDMLPGRRHWHPDHSGRLRNPTDHLLRLWASALDRAAEPLRARGVEVVNCSPTSALTAYPQIEFKEAVRCAN
jgi:hypothetical protein